MTIPTPKPYCRHCVYFLASKPEHEHSDGECHRLPPAQGTERYATFPRVLSRWHCGEWKKITEMPQTDELPVRVKSIISNELFGGIPDLQDYLEITDGLFQLVMALEEEFTIEISDDEWRAVETVGDARDR